jgi:uncharacterized DUF497 family protein
MEFEWDDEKAEANQAKHRITFEQGKRVFDDPRAVPFEDVEHSDIEQRYVVIGMSPVGLLFVSFTYRNDRIRIISARRASKQMQRIYEDEQS